MFRPLSAWIGLRYTRAKRRNHFISFISLASMLGIALGVAALIVVISVMNGFEREMRARMLSMISHATISGYNGDLADSEKALDVANADQRVLAAAPFIEREALLQGDSVAGAIVRGVVPDAEREVDEVAKHIKRGSLNSLQAGQYNVVIGIEMAFKLGVDIGDPITVMAPQMRVSPAGVLPQMRRFTVSGIFEVGAYEFDSGLVLIHLQDAQKLFRMQSNVTGVRLKLKDIFSAYETSRDLSRKLDEDATVSTWEDRNRNVFAAIRMERFTMSLILSLIVAVAAFNLVSTLVMMVTDKLADIAILRTMGATPATILRIFMTQGSLIGFFGTLLGAVFGVVTAINVPYLVPKIEQMLGHRVLDPSVYYISDVPSELRWTQVGLIILASLLMSLLATLYPAWRASRVQAAEALRYE
jgi:lipoprotein-releasing system permease protein